MLTAKKPQIKDYLGCVIPITPPIKARGSHADMTYGRFVEVNYLLRSLKVDKPVYGKPIGSHLGKPIYETIESDGHKYVFDRLAKCDYEGCPLDQLDKNEVMFRPGLIYRAA